MFNSNQQDRISEQLNRKIRQKRRKFLKTAGVILFILIIGIGTTFALLSKVTNTERNEFDFGKTEITVNENPDWSWESKEVTLTADAGSEYVPGVARAMIIPYVLGSDGNYMLSDLGELSSPTDNKMILGDFTLEFAEDWNTYWFYKAGFFYYRQVLNPGQTTTMLLKKVSLTNDTAEIRKKYKDAGIKVEVMAGILQAESGAPQTEWGVKVIEGVVSP